MAMTMNGEVRIAAPREVGWVKLNDAEVLKVCVPGYRDVRIVCKIPSGDANTRLSRASSFEDRGLFEQLYTP